MNSFLRVVASSPASWDGNVSFYIEPAIERGSVAASHLAQILNVLLDIIRWQRGQSSEHIECCLTLAPGKHMLA
jgi:hypothetical protein